MCRERIMDCQFGEGEGARKGWGVCRQGVILLQKQLFFLCFVDRERETETEKDRDEQRRLALRVNTVCEPSLRQFCQFTALPTLGPSMTTGRSTTRSFSQPLIQPPYFPGICRWKPPTPLLLPPTPTPLFPFSVTELRLA